MFCNQVIHDELVNFGRVFCDFCNEQIYEASSIRIPCCSQSNVELRDGVYVCLKCGTVDRCDIASEYIDFYENRYRIRRKSVYQRKYHISNVVMDTCVKNGIDITPRQKECILRIFKKVDEVIPIVNGSRKRSISQRYILWEVMTMLGLEYNKVPISKLKKTLLSYRLYWCKVLQLISNDVAIIIGRFN